MVDAIGVNRVAAGDIARVATIKAAAVEPVVTVKTGADAASSESIALSKTLANTPPVDTARVAQIRRAIANGTFPILPATIADRMLALKLEWTTHDEA